MTPPIACPADDVMLPFMMMSAAFSSAAPPSSAAVSTLARIRDVLRIISPSGSWRGNGLQIRRDRGDLFGLEVMAEAGHARRAVADHLAHHIFLAAERLAREGRAVERTRQLRL